MKTKAFRVLLTAGMAVVSTCVVSAQSTMTLPTVGLLGEFTKKTLVGSWVETVHFNNGRPDLKSLVSFHADGTMMSSDQGSVTLGPTPPPGVSSSGVGAWTQLDWHTFAYTDNPHHRHSKQFRRANQRGSAACAALTRSSIKTVGITSGTESESFRPMRRSSCLRSWIRN
jgi:hypothetical protein